MVTTEMKTAEKKKFQPLPLCLCLECKRPECHGIGKPLSQGAAIQANAQGRAVAVRCR